eukprot:g25163.t2
MEDEDGCDHLYKVVLVGDATVGKTHLLSRYVKGTLPKAPTATIGVEFATRTIPLAVGGTVKAQIWDTAGQERYRAITSSHYRRAVGALLDVTRNATFQNCLKWLEELRQNAEPNIIIMLVGNKLDLVEKDPTARQVHYDAASEFARQHKLLFKEASAVTTYNVKHVFEQLLQEVYNQASKNAKERRREPGGIQIQPGGTIPEIMKTSGVEWTMMFQAADDFAKKNKLRKLGDSKEAAAKWAAFYPDEAVHGLRDWLDRRGLRRHFEAVNEWCKTMGAETWRKL